MTLTAVCSSTGTLCTSLPEERDASPHHHPGEKPPESLSLNIARLHVRGVCQEEEARGAAVARGPEALRGNQQDAGRGELGHGGHRGDEEREEHHLDSASANIVLDHGKFPLGIDIPSF